MRIRVLEESRMVDRISSASSAETVEGSEELTDRKFDTGTGTEIGDHCDDALDAALTGNESSAVSEDCDIPEPMHRLLRGPCTQNTLAFVKGIERPQTTQREREVEVR